MFYALNWFVVVALLAFWSVTAWALHAVAVWAVSSAGALPGAASGVATVALPDWLAPWVPPEIVQAMVSLLSGLAPVVESLLQAAPALAGGLFRRWCRGTPGDAWLFAGLWALRFFARLEFFLPIDLPILFVDVNIDEGKK